MSPSSTITDAVLNKILTFLAPLFLQTALGDTEAARGTAKALLDSYQPRNDRELRHAALSIAFGFGALDALGKAASPDITINQALRLRGNAATLNRAACQNDARLDKLQKAPPEPAEADVPLPTTTATQDLLSFIRAAAPLAAKATATPVAPAPISRQQRRAAERQAKKADLRKQEAARLAARRMGHAPAASDLATSPVG